MSRSKDFREGDGWGGRSREQAPNSWSQAFNFEGYPRTIVFILLQFFSCSFSYDFEVVFLSPPAVVFILLQAVFFNFEVDRSPPAIVFILLQFLSCFFCHL